MDAIVYLSNTGFTEEYAQMLGRRTGLKVLPLEEARRQLAAGSEIVYLGWLMAGRVKGYPEAAKRFRIRAVCGVGLGESGSQLDAVRKSNGMPEDTPAFTLQGGFDMARLRGVYRWMMRLFRGALERQMAAKPDRTPGEELALSMLRGGGSSVREENLEPVLDWLKDQ